MSDSGLADDLFGESEGEVQLSKPQSFVSPVASGSRTPVPKAESPVQSPKREPRRDPDEDEDDGDLFGEDDEDEAPAKAERDERGRSSTATPASDRSAGENPLEYPEEETEDVHENWTTYVLPQWPHLEPSDGKIWNFRLPAYLNVESEPYDPEYYKVMNNEEPIDAEKDPLLAKQKMLSVKNTIRWRWEEGPDGEMERKSNAKMVRWSDGSVSLRLGDDLFDVAPSHGATLAREQDLEKQGVAPKAQASSSSLTTFLTCASTTERVLQVEGAIAGHLSLVPTSMTSKTHMELVKHVGQQHVKHSRMKILDDIGDNDFVKKMLMKAAGHDQPVKSKTVRRNKSSGRVGKNRSSRASRMAYSDDSGSDTGGAARKAGPNAYDEDDGFVVADEDEDEAEETEDEDEDDRAWGSSKKSKRKTKKRKGSDDDNDEDDMEAAERRIEQMEREKKRARREKDSSKPKKSRDYVDTDDEVDQDEDAEGEPDVEEQDMEMDVESEED